MLKGMQPGKSTTQTFGRGQDSPESTWYIQRRFVTTDQSRNTVIKSAGYEVPCLPIQ